MIDLHSHVLPGIDDGAKDIEMSLQMMREAKKQGVSIVAGTSHCMPENEEKVDEFLIKRQSAYESLMEKIGDSDEYPKLIYGAEVYLGTDVSEFKKLHELCYQNTDYILLEIVDNFPMKSISEWVYNIKIKGLKPVIAHVDRYSKCMDILEELAPLDVIFQINAGRFLSMGGRRKVKQIFQMHDKFLVSSDMHNLTTRMPNMIKASDIVSKKFSPLHTMLFEDMGNCIVNNK